MSLARRNDHRGKAPKILVARPIEPDDLRLIKQQRQRYYVQELRDSHHLVARLIASGLRTSEVAERSGYSNASIYRLNQDPAFNELTAQYRKVLNKGFEGELDEYGRLLLSNRMKAERRLADKLDNEDTEITARDLITISRDAADRTGYGKRSTNVNLNVGMGSLIENAWAKSGRAPPMLEAKPNSNPGEPTRPETQAATLDRRGL